jgi:DNA adenine methylase
MKTNTLISWPGGKSRHLKRILPYIPTGKGTGYIEPFAGGCAVLLAKERSTLEVVNDINGDLVNLYRVAALHPEELVRCLGAFPPASREHIAISRAILANPVVTTDVMRAAHFLHLNKTSFAGSGTSVAVVVNPTGKPWIGTERMIERIREFHARFDTVVIECQSYERILETYDHPRNFIFLDPPYGGKAIQNYSPWGEPELRAFRDRVLKLRGQWIVSLDDSAFNRDLWAGHDIEFVTSASGTGNKRKTPNMKFGEMLVYSPGLREMTAARAA